MKPIECYLRVVDVCTALRPEQIWRDSSLPLEVDLGCGDGGFLVQMAERFPKRNFLGVERLLGRVRKACRRGARMELKNYRIMRMEIGYAVKYLLPRGGVDVMHYAFPDPWPKRRHQGRRFFQQETLLEIGNVLKPGGELRLSTDHDGYFEHMCEVAKQGKAFVVEAWEVEKDYPMTDFERYFAEQGISPHRLRLRRVEE